MSYLTDSSPSLPNNGHFQHPAPQGYGEALSLNPDDIVFRQIQVHNNPFIWSSSGSSSLPEIPVEPHLQPLFNSQPLYLYQNHTSPSLQQYQRHSEVMNQVPDIRITEIEEVDLEWRIRDQTVLSGAPSIGSNPSHGGTPLPLRLTETYTKKSDSMPAKLDIHQHNSICNELRKAISAPVYAYQNRWAICNQGIGNMHIAYYQHECQVQAARNQAEMIRQIEMAVCWQYKEEMLAEKENQMIQEHEEKQQMLIQEHEEKQQMLAEKEEVLLEREKSMNKESEKDKKEICGLTAENESLRAQIEEMQMLIIKRGLSNLPD